MIFQALDWPEGFSVTSAKKMYNERMNGLELSRAQKDRIISIKREVFALNNELIREVSHSPESKATIWWFLQRVMCVILLIILIAGYLYYR